MRKFPALMSSCYVLLQTFDSCPLPVFPLAVVLQDQPGSKQKSIAFFEHDKSSNELIPACIEIPTDGIDEWEIDVKQLKIEKKVASGSYGDL